MNNLTKGLKSLLSRVVASFKNKKFSINPKSKDTLKGCKNIIKNIASFFKKVSTKEIIRAIIFIFIIVFFVIFILRLHAQKNYIEKLEETVSYIEENYNYKIEELEKNNTEVTNQYEETKKENEELLKKVEELNNSIAKLKKEQSNNVKKQTSNNYSVNSAQPVNASADDRTLLAKIIFAEAGGSTEEDMFLVGNVVMNRVASDRFPNTIRSVIYAKGQYSPTWNGAINKTPSTTAYACADRLLAGERQAPANVVYQAQFKQGSGLWKKVGSHYYCYM